jgi:glycosyltransferase involved in cell wall biosynthesis
MTPEGFYTNDEAFYAGVAENILKKGEFGLKTVGGYVISEPLYPLFLSGVFYLFGSSWDVVRVIQIILFACIVLFVFFIAEELFGRKIAFYSGLLMALFYPLAGMTGRLLREVFFTFLIVIFIWSILKAIKVRQKKWFIFSGIFLGLAILTNVIVQFLPFLILFNLLVIFRQNWKKAVSIALFFLLGVLLIVGPWFLKGVISDSHAISTKKEGNVLFLRVGLAETLQGKYKEHFIGQAFGYFLAKKINPELNSKEFERISTTTREEIKKLVKPNLSYSEANKILLRASLEKIFAQPFSFLALNFLSFLSFNNPMIPNPRDFQSYRAQELFTSGSLGLSDFAKGGIILIIRFFWLAFFFFVGWAIFKNLKNSLLDSSKHWLKFGWIFLIIIYFNLVYSLAHGIPRYALPIYPFYIILFVAGFLSFFQSRTPSSRFRIVCYFGSYNSQYSRNRILITGLRENGIKVLECNDRSSGLEKYFRLFLKHRRIKNKYDLMIVGFPSQWVSFDLVLAKIISRKPIIFDAFASIYDSLVLDKQLVRRGSFKARFYWFLDWLNCRLADRILLDTNEQIKFFSKTFKIREDKFKRIFVGSDEKIFYPQPDQFHTKFTVHFHGTCIPLQGIEYIVRAAKLLEKEEIQFNFIGQGREYPRARKIAKELQIKNINFIDFVPYEKLAEYINQVDVCLGIFGTSPKTQRVIPNKVFEAIAVKKAVITGDTPAIKELLTDQKNCLLCQVGNSQDLAEKILELKNNPALRNRIAENGYLLFKQKLTPKILGAELKKSFLSSVDAHYTCQAEFTS